MPRILSVKQPWAWAIMYRHKDIDTRTWSTKYRGLVIIHASSTYAYGAQKRLKKKWGIIAPDKKNLPFGKIIGICYLDNVIRKKEAIERKLDLWFEGPIGLVLTKPVSLKQPLKFKAKQRPLCRTTNEILSKVRGKLSIKQRKWFNKVLKAQYAKN